MTSVRITHSYQLAGQVCRNVYNYHSTTINPTATQGSELLDYWADFIKPAIKAIQGQDCVDVGLNIWLYARSISIDGFSSTPGGLAISDDDLAPVDLPLNIRLAVGDTLNYDAGTLYTGNRQIRRGRRFLSGLPKAFMQATGILVPATYATAYAAMLAAMEAPIQTQAGASFFASVLGYPLDALPPSPTYPGGRAARGFVVAPVVDANGVEFTKLKTRDE